MVSSCDYAPSSSSHMPSVGHITHMSVVSFVILGKKGAWARYKFPLDSKHQGQPQQPPAGPQTAAYPETVQPVAHVGEALPGGDVVHEHHSVGLAQKLPSHAVVPAGTVCVRRGLVGRSLALASPGLSHFICRVGELTFLPLTAPRREHASIFLLAV